MCACDFEQIFSFVVIGELSIGLLRGLPLSVSSDGLPVPPKGELSLASPFEKGDDGEGGQAYNSTCYGKRSI